MTNTGQVADTFDLALGGPAALVAKLGTTQVTLAPGASQVVPVTTGAAAFALPGGLDLVAMATSRGNSAVREQAAAQMAVPQSQGLSVRFDPDTQVLPNPGTATFLLRVDNTGNTEDAYTAVIMGTDGAVTASLDGLDGQPTQSIPVFRLPGLATGAILLRADLLATGQGTVTIAVRSLSNGALVATATAIVTAGTAPPVATDGPRVTQVVRYGVHSMPTQFVLSFDGPLDPASAEPGKLPPYRSRLRDPAGLGSL